MLKSLVSVLILCFSFTSMANVEHELIRRIAVFPLQIDKKLAKSAEDTWWEIRDLLTKNKKFLVASKNFMLQKDVFQSRGKLVPADAIILSQILDAQAVVTTYVKKRTIFMSVYESKYGRVLWSRSLKLHPSLPLKGQVKDAGKKLMLDFMSSIPYQGFIHTDELIGKPIYTKLGKKLVKVDVGLDSSIKKGDKVQFIKLTSDSLKPLFDGGGTIEVFSEGTVKDVSREIVTIKVDRYTKLKDFKKYGLVRLPKEYSRLRDQFAISENYKKNINPEYFSADIVTENQKQKEKKPLVAALVFIANIVGFLLLAL